MKLYRGDNIFNQKTKPNLYRDNGIRSKAFGSNGNPLNIELQGLTESIKKHINPIEIDISYYDVTDFISFSECEERAKYWCSDKGGLILKDAEDYKETRYIFIVNIDEAYKERLEDGVYLFKYKCNPLLKSSDNNNPFVDVAIRLGVDTYKCPICSQSNDFHSLILVDVVEYLNKNPEQQKYKGAIEFAKKDKEWLLLPNDKVEKHDHIRTTRIPRANFWTVNLYTVAGEERPS